MSGNGNGSEQAAVTYVDVELSECCGAPVIMVRADISEFLFTESSYEERPGLLARLDRDYSVAEQSAFWQIDDVRVYLDCCAQCRKRVRGPWIDECEDPQEEGQ